MEKRPTNLNFLTIHFSVTAWVSILHRLSGIFVFLLIPVLLWIFQESVASPERSKALYAAFNNTFTRCIVWALLAAFLYHFIAGIRHLLMDIHIGESKLQGRLSAWLVLCSAFLVFLAVGYWLCSK